MSSSRAPTIVSELTRPFWAAAARHELVRPVCAACGSSFFTPQVACPSCQSEDWEFEASTGRGTIHSFTVVHRAPTQGFDPPYVVADVELEEGWNMMTNIVQCPPEQVRIGAAVCVTWLDLDGPGPAPATLPVFELEEAGQP